MLTYEEAKAIEKIKHHNKLVELEKEREIMKEEIRLKEAIERRKKWCCLAEHIFQKARYYFIVGFSQQGSGLHTQEIGRTD